MLTQLAWPRDLPSVDHANGVQTIVSLPQRAVLLAFAEALPGWQTEWRRNPAAPPSYGHTAVTLYGPWAPPLEFSWLALAHLNRAAEVVALMRYSDQMDGQPSDSGSARR